MSGSGRWRGILIHESATKSHSFDLDAIGRLQKLVPRRRPRNMTVLLRDLIANRPDDSPPAAPADEAKPCIRALQPLQLPFPRIRVSPHEEANLAGNWEHTNPGEDT
jgi:hypothetical protein